MKYLNTSTCILILTLMCECNAKTHHSLTEELPNEPALALPDQPDIANPAAQAYKSSDTVSINRLDRKHSKSADIPDVDNFFDPGSHPVNKPKLTKPSFIVVWARTCGIYLLHKVMGIADWAKGFIARNEKKHASTKAKIKKS